MNELVTISNDRIDQIEKVMLETFPEVKSDLIHRFLDGVYIREILMKEGSLITSKIHRTRHPYVVLEGAVSVWVNGGEEMLIVASLDLPFEGITEPGTRRVLYCHTDVRWATFHLNPDNQDLEGIEERIIEKHENLLISKTEKSCLAKSLQTNFNEVGLQPV